MSEIPITTLDRGGYQDLEEYLPSVGIQNQTIEVENTYQRKFRVAEANHRFLTLECGQSAAESVNKRFFNHLVITHHDAGELAHLGVPKFDIELAAAVGLSLDSVVERLLEELGQSDSYIEDQLIKFGFREDDPPIILLRSGGVWSVKFHRDLIIKSLRYMDLLGCARVNWEQVERIYPGASLVELDLARDAFDHDMDIDESYSDFKLSDIVIITSSIPSLN